MKSTFVIFVCLITANVIAASDAIIWQQELSCDPNLPCKPSAMIVDKINNEAVILGTSKASGTTEANLWLWKIDSNGIVANTKSLGLLSKYGSFMVESFGIKATVKPDTGDIVRLKLDDTDTVSLSVTNRNMQSSAVKVNTPARKLSGTLILHDTTWFQNNNLLSVGQDGEDGIIMRTDPGGGAGYLFCQQCSMGDRMR